MPHFTRRAQAPAIRGDYRSFRPAVQEDFRRQCAYCLLGEILAGGEENFELDHFHPKSLFPDQSNNFYNIYYACHPCNHIKRDAWPPRNLEARGIGFVDLCSTDFASHFRVNADATWGGITQSGSYTIESLRLNRRHLVNLRQLLSQLGVQAHDLRVSVEELRRLIWPGETSAAQD